MQFVSMLLLCCEYFAGILLVVCVHYVGILWYYVSIVCIVFVLCVYSVCIM